MRLYKRVGLYLISHFGMRNSQRKTSGVAKFIVNKIAIIADDLTGAADTGVQFYPFFEETVLLPYHQLRLDSEAMSSSASRAISIYTGSRGLETRAASNRVRAAARQLIKSESKWFYKKIDSCLRGNLGAEIEAIMDTLGFELSFIAPAFPQMGRTTVNDIHQVHGIPVSRTEIYRDPVAPVTESRLSKVVAQQSRYKVGHVALDLLQGDETRLQKEIVRLVSRGARHIVFDSTSQNHLDNLSRLLLSSDRRILPVGSAGLAAGIGTLLPRKPPSKKYESRAPESGNHLLVSGTASKVTKRQIEALVQTYPYEEIILGVDLLADYGQRDVLLKKASHAALVLSSENVILRIGSSTSDQTTDSRPKGWRMAELVVEGMGFFVAAALNRCKPGFIFATGGDTADAVLTALNGGGIRILGEIMSGMVAGKIIGGPMNGLAIITKAGAFGNEDTLVVLHETWEKIKAEPT